MRWSVDSPHSGNLDDHVSLRLGDISRADPAGGGVYPDGWLFPRRMRVSASSAEAVMRKRLTAFNTGVAPSRMRPYIMMVRGASEPTSISVVLKFSKDMRKAIAAEPMSAG